MVVSTLLGIVRDDPPYEIKNVKQLIKDRYGYDISYEKAWLSLKRAMESVYGTWESSVYLLPKYLGALVKYNPGTIVECNHLPTNNPGVKILNYVFWAFRPCIDGFTHCRKIICVDGVHLHSKYNCKMLIAVCLDANNQILPLAFAFVDDENYDSWKWFLENLSRHVVCGVRGVCLISDRHRAIIRAVDEVPDFRHPHGMHCFCLRHVCSSLNTRFSDVHLKDLCWHAGMHHQIRKFDVTMDAIKNKQPLAHKYLLGIPREKWTLAHDGGRRCEIMTTKMSECLDDVLKGVQRLPISAIVWVTFHRCVQYFVQRVLEIQRMIQNKQLWPDYAYHKYEQWFARSSNHTVTQFDAMEKLASVTTGGGQHIQTVQLTTRECSCDEYYWDTLTFELYQNPAQCERRRSRRDRSARTRDEIDRPTIEEGEHISSDNSSELYCL
ncbi:uncharacterized protein [Henckelia pumila]|uniref:uncharacterized protein n=1 Tax=Henckelia pumila TaxID=405737 RepID=UPI003C6DD54B